mmetsp:Transcript_14176/g.42113  ORF Transcript_14176/g.42113 Transcript_14176/m.42113 type:complete len:133 (-) Transcript_14176:1658-2056(-)
MNITPTTWVQSSRDHARYIRPQPTHLASSDEMSRCATCVHNRKTNNNEDGNQTSSTLAKYSRFQQRMRLAWNANDSLSQRIGSSDFTHQPPYLLPDGGTHGSESEFNSVSLVMLSPGQERRHCSHQCGGSHQ